MTRLFFDIVQSNARSYDYSGHYFSDVSQAKSAAQELSLDLSCSSNIDWQDATVEVRDASGLRLFAVPVEQLG